MNLMNLVVRPGGKWLHRVWYRGALGEPKRYGTSKPGTSPSVSGLGAEQHQSNTSVFQTMAVCIARRRDPRCAAGIRYVRMRCS